MAIYFIQCGQFIKIGKANYPERRLLELQIGCPYDLTLLATLPGDEREELYFHRLFVDRRHKGEWFALTGDEIANAIGEYLAWNGLSPEERVKKIAKILMDKEGVLEVMLVSSDLPTVATTDNEVEMESGVWFLCRADVPPLGESITRFVRKV